MILPTKHVTLDKSLLGAGALVLPLLTEPKTITGLWDKLKTAPQINSYGRFVLVLDFLFAVGAIEFVEGLVCRVNQ